MRRLLVRCCGRRFRCGAGPPSPTSSTSRSHRQRSRVWRSLRLTALEERIEADLALGAQADLAGELESLVSANPLRERLRAQLMLVLYRTGRQADALEAYRAAHRTLDEQLGIAPGPMLQRLQEQILRQDPALDASYERSAPHS